MNKSIALPAVTLILATTVAWSEVVLDGSMGRAGAVPQNGNDYAVTRNLGQIRGANLYHSFSQFNIRAGESATFSGPGGLANVLSRVTGGNASNIDGLLRSTVPGANFWFVNPSGVFFGPGASIDVPGSFYAGTANYIGFADGSRFDATNPATTTLTAAAPTAFGFLGAEPAPLQVMGSDLSVSEGSELLLVGGDLRVGGGAALHASEGAIRLEGVGSAGEVSLRSPVIEVGDVSGGSTIAVSDSEIAGQTLIIRGGSIETAGETNLEVSTSSPDHDSRVEVLAQVDVDLGGSTWVRANGASGGEARIESKTGTTSLHGSVEARGESGLGGHVELLGVNVGLFGDAFVDVSGEQGGGIALIGGDYQGLGPIRTAARTYVGADALIRADARSQGDGGRVIVWGGERAVFDGRISARGGSLWGDGGFAEVSSPGVLAFQGGVDLGAVNGAVGELLLDPQSITISNATDDDVTPESPFEPVPPGPSTLNVSTLVNALKTADVTVATSDSGPDPSDPGDINLTAPIDYDGIGDGDRTLTLRAHNDVNIDASITDEDPLDGLDFINLVLESDSDNAVSGDVNIRADIQTNGGDVSATGQGISIVETTLVTDSVDGAGDVALLAGKAIVLDNASIESDAVDSGVAGFITIDAGESISLDNSILSTVSFDDGDSVENLPGEIALRAPAIELMGSLIDATSFGEAAAGFVELGAENVVALENTTINSDADAGEAGLISIDAGESISLKNTTLSTVSFAFDGDPDKPPGVIELGASEIELVDAIIEATSTGGAGAGDVILNADRTVKLENSVVLSEAKTVGEGGFISIAAGESISQNGGTISTAVNASNVANGDVETDGPLLGEIELLAPEIELANATIAATSTGTADAGDVTLGGETITVTAGSNISSDSFGTNVDSDAGEVAGNAGTVFIVGVDGENDSQAVDVSLLQSIIRSDAKTDGQGGVIFINASGSITQDGGTISTTVNDRNVENGDGDGDGQPPGVIELGASEIELVDAIIEATSTGGAGAGDLILNADRTVKLENSVVLSEAKTVGEGGFISIAAGESISQNGGTISTAVNDSDVEGGLLGAIALVAPDIELFDATIEATSTGTADAGDVTLGGDTVTVSWSRITSSSLGTTKKEGALAGLAGTVFVVGSRGDDNSIARRLRVTGNSVLETNGQLTGGGDIELRVTDRIEFEDSRVTANATGDGGNITITGQPNVVVLRSSHINANSKVGNGGIIEIKADVFLATPDSTVTARTEDKRQLEGVVDIDAAGADVVGGLAQLPANFQDPGRLLLTPCGQRVGTAGSRIEVSPLAGLPQSPEEYFFSSTSPVQYPYGDDTLSEDETASGGGSHGVYMLAMSPCAERYRVN